VFIVRFLPSRKIAHLHSSASILEAAREAGVGIESTCGGKHKCGKCKVVVKSDPQSLSPPDEIEQKILGPSLLQRGYRLACMARVSKDTSVFVPRESRSAAQVILTSARDLPSPNSLRSPLKAYDIEVPPPTLSSPIADRERLLNLMASEYRLPHLATDPHVVRKIPFALRQNEGKVAVMVRKGQEIIGISEKKYSTAWGVAVDLGSTTIVAYLVDLFGANIVATKSTMNPQIPYGDDVISRISFCQQEAHGLQKLHKAAISAINGLIAEACEAADIMPEHIMEVAVVGNTAMHHFFLGVDPRFVSLAPYAPCLSSAQAYKASELGIKISNSGYVYLPPIKAGFVGSDSIACVLSTGLYRSRTNSLLIDIGTNGEIVLGNRDRMICCSTAAGPAFEGGHVKWGMRAASGAIEQVRIDPKTLDVTLSTIHGQQPIGICGSGLISAVAELIRTGCISHRGSFNKDLNTNRLRKGQRGMEFVLSWKEENPTGHDIVITQKDIAELQMAKGAIRAGISILMESLGSDIKRIYLAGAGGNYIDPSDAQTIGLIPSPPGCRIIGCGNAAGHGACLALIDLKSRRHAEKIANKMEYVELAGSARFQDLFFSHMFFEPPH